MIDASKTYRTQDGREVRIYATDGGGDFSVHGAIYDGGIWHTCSWKSTGRVTSSSKCRLDLIEVRPRIKRTVWANVYPDGHVVTSKSKHDADRGASSSRLACIPITIDCEEGEGL